MNNTPTKMSASNMIINLAISEVGRVGKELDAARAAQIENDTVVNRRKVARATHYEALAILDLQDAFELAEDIRSKGLSSIDLYLGRRTTTSPRKKPAQ